jgi:hypothetical protein
MYLKEFGVCRFEEAYSSYDEIYGRPWDNTDLTVSEISQHKY